MLRPGRVSPVDYWRLLTDGSHERYSADRLIDRGDLWRAAHDRPRRSGLKKWSANSSGKPLICLERMVDLRKFG
jgi:hypothetical protein